MLAPTRRDDGIPPNQVEFKTRRLVNDYLQPPKVTRKYQLAQQRFAEVRDDMENQMMARNAHELMRALEAQSIMDCADMAAFASLYRTESRWGLYHARTDYPVKDDDNWFCNAVAQAGRPHGVRKARGGPLHRADRRRREGPVRQAAHPRDRLRIAMLPLVSPPPTRSCAWRKGGAQASRLAR